MGTSALPGAAYIAAYALAQVQHIYQLSIVIQMCFIGRILNIYICIYLYSITLHTKSALKMQNHLTQHTKSPYIDYIHTYFSSIANYITNHTGKRFLFTIHHLLCL